MKDIGLCQSVSRFLVKQRLMLTKPFCQMIGEVLIGLSAGLIFSLVTTVLVEILPQRGASLVALNSLGRNFFATIGTAIAQPIQSAIGSGWLFSIFALVSLVSILVIILMRRYGRQWREAAVAASIGAG